MNRSPEPLRLAAIGDLHVAEDMAAPYRDLFAEISGCADALALCGDLTNFGRPAEAELLAAGLSACRIPMVGVLGNHDCESGAAGDVARILEGAGVRLLDGEATEIAGVGFAGVKGFIGGFGRGLLAAFGEPALKAVVQASLEESLKLERALQMLRTERIVVVLHYSPVAATLIGEPPEIYPFLGNSRLAETIDRFPAVRAVTHGHAHRGRHLGRTPGGAPVYNVARMVAQAELGRPFALIEI
ncbi:MAG TPA: metallophosphoesterase [Caulobacteraceae bacterium]|nr:metallophosphoesterase [Caulobacteraceae bacterium]